MKLHNKKGANRQPCLTPDKVQIGRDKLCAVRTGEVELYCQLGDRKEAVR